MLRICVTRWGAVIYNRLLYAFFEKEFFDFELFEEHKRICRLILIPRLLASRLNT